MDKIEAFITEVSAALPPDGKADFEPYGNGVELSDLRADIPGQGWGTRAVEVIVRLADAHKMDIMVIPAGRRHSKPRLVEFYGRFGFFGEDALHRSAA